MGLICLNALCYRFFQLFLIYKVSCVSATTTTLETNFNVVLENRFLLSDEKSSFLSFHRQSCSTTITQMMLTYLR